VTGEWASSAPKARLGVPRMSGNPAAVATDAANAVEPGNEICTRALRLLAVHPLRAADALQLAAALVWFRDHPAGLDFVCLDERLRTAALLDRPRVGFREV